MIGTENVLLASLDERVRERLLWTARPTRLVTSRTLFRPNEEIASVVFPLQGMISIATDLGDETGAEISLVGPEGLVGARPLLTGSGSFTNVRARVVVPGRALEVPASDFADASDRSPTLRDRIDAFLDLQFTQAVQEAACLRAHRADQRLARWLLQADDRAPERTFAMTQDLLADILGVRRATVTEAMRVLRDGGLVRTGRGRVTITDRPGLEAAACVCYEPNAAAFREYLRACLGSGPTP